MMKEKFAVKGMTCSACSASVESSVSALTFVQSVQVNLLSGEMRVEHDGPGDAAELISRAVADAGYTAFPANEQAEPGTATSAAKEAPDAEWQLLRQRLIVSSAFTLPLLYLAMGHMFDWPLPDLFHGMANSLTFALTQFLLIMPVIVVNRRYYQAGFRSLFKGHPNMDTLIALGTSAATLYGVWALYRIGYGLGHDLPELVMRYSMDLYFESAAVILTLITLGKFLESRSKSKTTEAISRLIKLAPQTATLVRDGVEVEVGIAAVAVGDLVAVRPGQSIPVDGIIETGATAIDQSMLTGESIPVEKTPGDSVAAATINRSGYFRFRATKIGQDTTLARIIALVEEAGSSKAPIARLADRISGIFVPVVMVIALIAGLVWLLSGATFEFALTTAIAVLVISCPCALGLATPVAIMVGTGKGAGNGILIRSGEALETAHAVDTVVLDKTGTLTEGKPCVTDILPDDPLSEEALIQIAAALEEPSEHPLAEAILDLARTWQLSWTAVEDFVAVPGRGITARSGGKRYYAGNPAYLEANGILVDAWRDKGEKLAQDGKTPLFFADQDQVIGLIAVSDPIKPTSQQAVRQLRQMGLTVIMLTGDNRRTAEAIRSQLDLDRVIAEVLPEDKEREVRQLQAEGRKVAMIGDGINDAPALMRSDVGIAIGAGTDVAIESADIILMRSDLLDAVTAIRLSQAVIRNIRQNLFWAFFYNVIGIPLAAGLFYPLLGWLLSPMFAAAAMSLSSVSVVTNALRLKRFEPSQPAQSIKKGLRML